LFGFFDRKKAIEVDNGVTLGFISRMRVGWPIDFRRCRQITVLLAALLPVVGLAQRRGGGDRYLDDLSNQEFKWPIDPAFTEDVFTFARLRFESGGGGFGYRRGGWSEDMPLADTMLAYRVHQITAITVRPGVNPIDITKTDLAQFPFVYMCGVGGMSFREDEVVALRDYLLNGGFMMVDNFWGDAAWSHFSGQMRRLFPNRAPVELGLDHVIFHTVYNLKAKPQMPSAGVFSNYGIFYDPRYDYDVLGHDPHYFTISDDKGRIMVLLCHNNHYGDGWEHEGDDPVYFHTISEGMAYPMFVNVLVYAMTH
jgi:hypothetical protein